MNNVLLIEGLSKSYTKNEITPAVNAVSLSLKEGEICAVVGQSGCGKSTLLRMIAGLEVPDKGNIVLNGKTVASPNVFTEPEHREVGFVFQSFALFPHLTVSQNIGFGVKGDNRNERTAELLELVNLKGYQNKYPHELSGGEQQRIALARALAPKPSIILLDEPFSNLDANLKSQLRDELFKIIKKAAVSCLFVTHDIDDAMAVADNLSVLRKGEIVQTGTPNTLYKKPKNSYVANLFEELNEISAEDLLLLGHTLDENKSYGLRPKDISLTTIPNESKENNIANLIDYRNLGRYTVCSVEISNQKILRVIIPSKAFNPTDGAFITFDLEDLITFE